MMFSFNLLLLADVNQLQLKRLLVEPGRAWEVLPAKEGPVFSLLVPLLLKK